MHTPDGRFCGRFIYFVHSLRIRGSEAKRRREIGQGDDEGTNNFLKEASFLEGMEFIQIVAVLFALFAFTRVLLRLKEKKLSALEFVFWTFIWVGLVLVALFPETFSSIANSVGIKSGTGLVTYLALIIIFYLMFRVYVKLDTLEQEITLLARESSMRRFRPTKRSRR